MNTAIGIKDILKVYQKKGYNIAENDVKPFNLNICGIRSMNGRVNYFDDIICIFWKYKGSWSIVKSIATVDPGLYWLNNPENKNGTGILKEGQYTGMWKKEFHRGDKNEPAFVQVKPCTVIRDSNKDSIINYDADKEETGLFGINGHNANNLKESILVDKWSAACQVWANPEEHALAMWLADKSIPHWGNSFSYTLINESNIELK